MSTDNPFHQKWCRLCYERRPSKDHYCYRCGDLLWITRCVNCRWEADPDDIRCRQCGSLVQRESE